MEFLEYGGRYIVLISDKVIRAWCIYECGWILHQPHSAINNYSVAIAVIAAVSAAASAATAAPNVAEAIHAMAQPAIAPLKHKLPQYPIMAFLLSLKFQYLKY